MHQSMFFGCSFSNEMRGEIVCPMRDITLQRLFLAIVVWLLRVSQPRICWPVAASDLNGERVGKPFVDEEALSTFSARSWKETQGVCGVAQRQGRRPYQEDRVICMPELYLPCLGGRPDHGFSVGLFGVFDGHNGAEASDMASIYLPHRLRYHTCSIMDSLERDCSCGSAGCSIREQEDVTGASGSSPLYHNCFDKQVWTYHGVCEDLSMKEKELSLSKRWDPVKFSDSMYRLILKEALSRALNDIDSAFSNEAWKKGWQGGSTAVVVLKAYGHLLAANIGDSKAIVCSSCSPASDFCQDFTIDHGKFQEFESLGTSVDEFPVPHSVKELTVDHHPNRLDERTRIEAAGGFVSTWSGVPRVNGQLAVTRAIGDILFKKYGVIAEPEFTDWQEITMNETFLFLASDGIFEMMKAQDVCNMLHKIHKKFCSLFVSESGSLYSKLFSQAVADAIVESAFERGSVDNLALVAYPLRACPCHWSTSYGSKSDSCEDPPHSSTGLPFASTVNTVSQDELLETFSTVASGSLLKGGEEASCYKLVERITHGVVLPLQTSVESYAAEVMSNVTENEGLFGINLKLALPYEHSSGHLEVYYAHPVCLLHPLLSDDDEVCLNPERFATYLRLIEAVPVIENNLTKAADWEANVVDPSQYHAYTRIHHRYVLTKNVGRGGFGEVWYAVNQHCLSEGKMGWSHFKKAPSGSLELQNIEVGLEGDCSSNTSEPETRTNLDNKEETYVLKRILVEKGDAVYLSGIREKYFGELFESIRYKQREEKKYKSSKEDKEDTKKGEGLKHIVRYVESLQLSTKGDLWLVFLNEGYPLSSLLYTVDKKEADEEEFNGRGHIQVLKPSNWWKWMKTSVAGQQEMRSLIYKLLLAVKTCHDLNITHRDIKPENMIIRATSWCSVTGQLHADMPCNLSMRIIDFGSAIDRYSLLNLYGAAGPSRAEQTAEYTPPENFLQRDWLQFHGNHASKYDMWSIGVVILELVLGTPHVFQISARTRALLDQRLEGWGQSALDMAYKLRALIEMCILFAGHRAHHHQILYSDSSDLASWRCTEENIMQQIKERDPLDIGLPDVWALRLLRGLLQWYPEDRISAEEALRHPYFHPTLQGKEEKT